MNLHRALSRSQWLAALIALAACGGGSSKTVEPTPPPPEPPTYTISARGGEGTIASGGWGGGFELLNDVGGDVKILRSGAVDTAVTLPTTLPYLGMNWVDVTADTTLEVAEAGFRLAENSYTVSNDKGVVTGIRVRPGVTLTIKPNFTDGDVTRLYVELSLDDGLIVEGTIKIAPRDQAAANDGLGADTASFTLESVGGLYIASTGKIDVSGKAHDGAVGGSGGSFTAWADVFNSVGEITTAGAAGTSGGYAGSIGIYAGDGYAISTGTLRTDGGAGGADGVGGSGNVISFNVEGYLVLAGTLSAVGGDGGMGGGSAGPVVTNSGAQTVVSATINAYGGAATSSGNGGDGIVFQFQAYGPMRLAGSLDGHGGKGAGDLGNGGNGAAFVVRPSYLWSSPSEALAPDATSLLLSGNIVLDGGAGAAGGNGGYISIVGLDPRRAAVRSANAAVQPTAPAIQLVAYTTIDSSGGSGKVGGGSAGSVEYEACVFYGCYWSNVVASWSYDWDGNGNYILGSVTNEADFVLRGGDGGSGQGGTGYGVDITTDHEIAPSLPAAKNSGSIDASGGRGDTGGGSAGVIRLYGMSSLDNSGALTASAGDGGTADAGGQAPIGLYSDGPVTSSATITANGGGSTSGSATPGGAVDVWCADACTVSGAITVSGGTSSTGVGGDGGYVIVFSDTNSSNVSGAITANGGSSTSGAGGDGGYVEVSSANGPSSLTGTPSVAAGTGTGEAPLAGEVWLDGMQIAGP